MNEWDLFSAMNDIDPQFILEAAPHANKTTPHKSRSLTFAFFASRRPALLFSWRLRFYCPRFSPILPKNLPRLK